MELIPFIISHQTYAEGGRKCHIGEYESGPLCGSNHPQLSSSPFVTVNDEWVTAGVASEELCRVCVKKYYKLKSQ